MNYEQFASDLPPNHIVFTSAEENEETMQRLGVDQQVRQVAKRNFQAGMAVRSTLVFREGAGHDLISSALCGSEAIIQIGSIERQHRLKSPHRQRST